MLLWLRTAVFGCGGTDVIVTSYFLGKAAVIYCCCGCSFVLFQQSCGVFSL
ncbi:unnamed protein product [Brassica oleracea var. botrytis]